MSQIDHDHYTNYRLLAVEALSQYDGDPGSPFAPGWLAEAQAYATLAVAAATAYSASHNDHVITMDAHREQPA